MKINYNGREKYTGDYKKLTYSEVIVLGFGPTDTDSIFTITYSHPKGAKGSLQPGETLKLKTGMSINCMQTNRA